MNAEAEVHQLKTEYAEVQQIQDIIVRQTSVLSPITHTYALANVALLDIVTGAGADTVSRSLDAADAIFRSAQYPRGILACEVFRADLRLHEGDVAGVCAEYIRLFAALLNDDAEAAW